MNSIDALYADDFTSLITRLIEKKRRRPLLLTLSSSAFSCLGIWTILNILFLRASRLLNIDSSHFSSIFLYHSINYYYYYYYYHYYYYCSFLDARYMVEKKAQISIEALRSFLIYDCLFELQSTYTTNYSAVHYYPNSFGFLQ